MNLVKTILIVLSCFSPRVPCTHQGGGEREREREREEPRKQASQTAPFSRFLMNQGRPENKKQNNDEGFENCGRKVGERVGILML